MPDYFFSVVFGEYNYGAGNIACTGIGAKDDTPLLLFILTSSVTASI